MDVKNMQITLVGAGNVATHLAKAFFENGFSIGEIYSRTLSRATALSEQITSSVATNNLDFSNSESRIFVVAVKDDAKRHISDHIKMPQNAMIFHTSGTVDISVLAPTNRPHGIFYPLQTFLSHQTQDFKQIPILIEGSSEKAVEILSQLAKSISNHVSTVSSADRKRLHLAAVFASNFTNRMLAAAEGILAPTTLPLQILQPLVNQSIQNAFQQGADKALTGPAKRADKMTMQQHLELLEDDSYLKELYAMISNQVNQ